MRDDVGGEQRLLNLLAESKRLAQAARSPAPLPVRRPVYCAGRSSSRIAARRSASACSPARGSGRENRPRVPWPDVEETFFCIWPPAIGDQKIIDLPRPSLTVAVDIKGEDADTQSEEGKEGVFSLAGHRCLAFVRPLFYD